MARRNRKIHNDGNPFDLFLDTVSNVFGGVMFLTLLAALLVLTHGASSIEPSERNPTPTDAEVLDARQVHLDIAAMELAVQTQQMLLSHLNLDSSDLDKGKQLEQLRGRIAAAKQNLKRAQSRIQRDDLANGLQEEEELQEERSQLERTLAAETRELEGLREASRRTVKFRPLRRAKTNEAVVVIRYGKLYLFKESPSSTDFNRDEFFLMEVADSAASISPKPHRGSAISDDSLARFIRRLRSSYPPRMFHVTIGVWNDSFSEFNLFRDAVTTAGYSYRTIPLDERGQLYFGTGADSWVQ